MIDVARARRDTPSTARYIHMLAAGASPSPEPVRLAVAAHLDRECEVGGYAAEAEATAAADDFYDAFAALLNCRRSEIAYVENATRAWDMVFYGLPLGRDDRILTCTSEYVSNVLPFLHLARTRGVAIDIAPDDASGQVDVDALEGMVTARTRLIAITHVPTQGGLVNPAEAVGRIARRHRITYLLDACQSVGQMPLDVDAIGCDFLSGTGRKFLRGPRGTGFLYARTSAMEGFHPPFIDLHSATWTSPDTYELAPDARRFENWESFVAGRIGLAVAVRYALALGLENIEARAMSLAQRLRDGLAAIPGVTLADKGARRCAIVTFHKAGEDPMAIKDRLAAASISSSVPKITSAQIDFSGRGLTSVVRLAPHYFNTEAEIDRALEVVAARPR